MRHNFFQAFPPDRPIPASISIQLPQGESVTALVRRSGRARNLRMSFLPRGSLELIVPAKASFEDVRQCLPKFLPWLEKNVAKRKTLPPPTLFPSTLRLSLLDLDLNIIRECNLAQGLSHAGRNSLLVTDGAKRTLVHQDGESLAFYGHVEDEAFLSAALRIYLRKLASMYLPPRLEILARKANSPKIKIMVRNQSSRWGSCSRRGNSTLSTISLNWRGILLPPQLFDHLCQHELAHLKEMNHSPAFYRELDKTSPHWREYEKALDDAWRSLPYWAFDK